MRIRTVSCIHLRLNKVVFIHSAPAMFRASLTNFREYFYVTWRLNTIYIAVSTLRIF